MSSSSPPDYVLGHSKAELQRLEEQAHFFGDLTALVFREAGLRERMHILDIGSGAGDVSLLAGRFVGSSGSVLGIDRSEEAVTAANARARAQGAKQVSFIAGDAGTMKFKRTFDAVVGRFVMMYQSQPAEMLRHVAAHTHPGGLLIFHEIDTGHLVSHPRVPLFEQITSWIVSTLRASGADPIMGLKLRQTYIDAGLPAPRVLITGRADGGADSPAYGVLVGVLRALLPAAERFGVVDAKEVQIDTLAARLRDEIVAANATILLPLLVGAWASKPRSK
jgi:2-polyprenyl-3-methyl-5-hydroxy-6-metoxy-1,4-benzoquinol methylase